MPQKKIAVLGGGLASITAVYKLTEEPGWKDRYEITIYQIGWRLGGKCASGRNAKVANRIEEHGLHLWFGFYDNAFDIIQKCYKENARPQGAPLASWEQAFQGHDFVCLEEYVDEQWKNWPFTLSCNEDTPGVGEQKLSKKEYLYRLIERQKKHQEEYELEIMSFEPDKTRETGSPGPDKKLLDDALQSLRTEEYIKAESHLESYNEQLDSLQFIETDEARRFFILSNLTIAIVIGMLKDKVINNGFNSINQYDFRDWLQRSGAKQKTIESALVQAVYGLVFGGRGQYSFEAGTALRGLLRLFLTYKGHVYYRMQDGMADVVFSPFYQVLSKRGVKFEFFHKVANLGLSSDKKNIETIAIDVQAKVKQGSYNPFLENKDSPCWPSCPNYSQLVQGEQLKEEQVDLESYYSTWQPVANKILKRQQDFDVIILGISIGAFPLIARELLQMSKQWQQMVEHVCPIPTVAFQLWLNKSIQEVGWPLASQGLALLGAYQQPYDTWADMSQLIDRENWPSNMKPQQIAYFCGPTPPDAAIQIMQNVCQANFNNPDFPKIQAEYARAMALQYINQLSEHVWPKASRRPNGTFDFDQLADISGQTGIGRFDAQYFRHNIDPTELYVMSFTNSSSYRLKTDKSGFDYLYLTGDWIDNGFNAGCVEATVMAGLQAARAISGQSFTIPWEDDF